MYGHWYAFGLSTVDVSLFEPITNMVFFIAGGSINEGTKMNSCEMVNAVTGHIKHLSAMISERSNFHVLSFPPIDFSYAQM